jgi:hypothetical protein
MIEFVGKDICVFKMTSFCFRCLCAPNFYGIHCKDRSNDCASGTNQELCGHGVCVNHDRNGFTCICEQVSDFRINLKSVRLFDFQLHVISLFLVNILDSTFLGPWFWTTQSRSDDISMFKPSRLTRFQYLVFINSWRSNGSYLFSVPTDLCYFNF